MNKTKLPKWEEKRLKDIFSLHRESIEPADHPEEMFEYFSLPTFDKTGTFETVAGKEIQSNKTVLSKPTILVSKLNPRKPRVMLVKGLTHRRRCASTEFMPYVPNNENVCLEFYKWYLESELFHGRLQLVATGSTNSHVRVTPSETLRWRVPFPPLPEQQKTATILTSVDNVIEKTEAQINKLQDLKKGMMQELLTKGIGHSEFKDGPVGRIPKGWKHSNIKKCCQIKNNLRKPISKEEREGMKGVYPYYGPTKAVDFINEYLIEGDHTLIGEDGDHFIKFSTWAMTQFVTGKFNVNNHAHVIQGTDECLTKWVYYYYLHRDITPHLTRQGATRYKLNKAALEEIDIVLPPVNEQREIIEILDSNTSLITRKKKKLEGLVKIKKALMQDLLTGKVRVKTD